MRQPFDRILKNTGEIDPRGLLHLLGVLPIGVEAEVTEANRELGLAPRFPDFLLKVSMPGRLPFLWHIEFQLHLRGIDPKRMLEYALYAWLHYGLPVFGVLLLPIERYARGETPDIFSGEIGGLRIEYRYRVVRLWEVDPAPIFELDRSQLLPLVPLMRATPADLRQAARALSAKGDRTLTESFAKIGALRYDRINHKELLSDMQIERIVETIWNGALAAEREEARAEALFSSISRILKRRFPAVAIPPELAASPDPEILESLLDDLISANTPAEAEAALRRASPPPPQP